MFLRLHWQLSGIILAGLPDALERTKEFVLKLGLSWNWPKNLTERSSAFLRVSTSFDIQSVFLNLCPVRKRGAWLRLLWSCCTNDLRALTIRTTADLLHLHEDRHVDLYRRSIRQLRRLISRLNSVKFLKNAALLRPTTKF